MLARIAYDSHPSGWAIILEAESEPEAAAIASFIRVGSSVATVRLDFAAADFVCTAIEGRKRVFILDLVDRKNIDAVGFSAPPKPEQGYMSGEPYGEKDVPSPCSCKRDDSGSGRSPDEEVHT